MDERVRYINIRVISSVELQEKELWFLISAEVKQLFGSIGAAEIGLFLSYFDQKNQCGIFRSSHKYVHRVKAALCFIHYHRNSPLFLYSESVTGSIKKAKELLINPKTIIKYHNLKKILYTQRESSFNDENLLD
ncbi:MAG: Rpp14/Pop5 family protein [Candidatus Hodarchaeales archaeon]|jgi:RNase P/RNase MRP subunit POP5